MQGYLFRKPGAVDVMAQIINGFGGVEIDPLAI
jgi:hypothetical protein